MVEHAHADLRSSNFDPDGRSPALSLSAVSINIRITPYNGKSNGKENGNEMEAGIIG